MSSSGGIQGHTGGHAQIPPGVVGKGAEGAQAGKTNTAEKIGRGFSNDNSVSFQQDRRLGKGAPGSERMVRLPQPKIDPASAAKPELLAQLSMPHDVKELITALDDLETALAEDVDGEIEGADDLGSSLFGAARTSKSQKGQQDQGMSYSSGGQGNRELAAMLVGGLSRAESFEDVEKVIKLQGDAFNALDRIANITGGPPETIAALKEAGNRLNQAMLTGDVEDVARILSEVQTKTQDIRMKFDEQAIRTSRQKREMVHGERIGKLTEALAKMKEAKTAGIVGKIFSAIATALAVVVAAVTIATGVGAKAGIALIMAATIMVAMTVSQNTGDWMTNMGGLIKDENVQLALGIGWSVLAAALSLGAGAGPAIKKKVTDMLSQVTQKSVKIAGEAAKQGAQAAAQTAQQSATAASNATQQGVQQATNAVQETAKNAVKASTEAADEAAQQAAKTAAKIAQETVKETSQEVAKETVKVTTENTAKETAKLTAEQTKYFRRAASIARFTEGTSKVTEGSAAIHGARVTHEGESYQADAHEDLAMLTQLQFQMEDWMEAIQQTLKDVGEGQKIASDMLAQAQSSKFTISRNI